MIHMYTWIRYNIPTICSDLEAKSDIEYDLLCSRVDPSKVPHICTFGCKPLLDQFTCKSGISLCVLFSHAD